MACFLVSAAEAVVVTAAEKVEKKREENGKEVSNVKIPMSQKFKWLRNMLLGGSVLLAFEHVWHGEVTPWFPFLTAMSDKADTAEMLHEMATVGVSMAALITLTWVGMCLVSNVIVKRQAKNTDEQTTV